MTNIITLEPLTAEAFKPYGDVIATTDRDYFMINNGSTRRYHQLADVDTETEGGRTIISIFQATPLTYPLSVSMMGASPARFTGVYSIIWQCVFNFSRRTNRRTKARTIR